ncbi:MAG: alpha/beta fold hydrolase [Ramlibacter sp.]
MKLLLKSIALLAGAALFFIVLGLYLTWAPDRPVDELKARWAQPPSQFITVQGMQVHVRDEGPRDDALPIVLLHGTSASLHTWQGWAAALKGQRRVIRFDMPGFGLTGPHPQDDYSMAAYVRFVAAVLDQLGVQRFVLAGNSLGGQIAWEFAHAHPQRVSHLVLVDAAGYAMAPREVPLGFRIARMPTLRPLMRNTLPRGMIEQSVRSVYGDPSRVTPDLVDQYYDMTQRAGNRRALGLRVEEIVREQAQAGASAARIASLKVPTLILWGGRDQLIPPDSAQRFARDIAGSRLVMFDDLGHVPHEEAPARTVAPVVEFLAR